jgi:hypothetical protein
MTQVSTTSTNLGGQHVPIPRVAAAGVSQLAATFCPLQKQAVEANIASEIYKDADSKSSFGNAKHCINSPLKSL